ncbi:hypothetical protein N5079_32895 [Planotetraspora sp. A-T 1434]|uniref:ABC transporter substrate-binding protein n=1 Tax=Planotetraspora sp. A-T 1434 TaxID=2979219 RepID=UPI0021C06EAA|nr:hypothetical protein [Planotetraspora sp. A-T 1434]MCT9935013.1 hypothetical protein [Planotetraspora sp. A-T 1434]
MPDLHGVIEGLVRRPFFWRADAPLPILVITGEADHASEVAKQLAAPFEDSLPHASVRSGEHDTLGDLVSALAGEQGQLGKPVGGSFLPAPRFPLVQFVLWARRQRAERPAADASETSFNRWPPDPQSRKGQEEFKERLKVWRRGRYGGDRGRRTAVDFIGRAAYTWVPLGTLAAWWFGGPSDLVGLLPWVLGVLVATLGTGVQSLLSIRGSLFNRWFRQQPYLPRKRFERLPRYALRLANASEADIDRLLVHAMCQDLHQAYKKWPIPWPSWGRGLYGLLVLEARKPGEANERFLRILEETTEETGLLAPVLVLAAMPQALTAERPPTPPLELGRLPKAVDGWRETVRRRVPRLRLVVDAAGTPPGDDYRLRLYPSVARAIGYWSVVALLLVGPAVWLIRNQQDIDAHCGGLPWVERIGAECIGIVNATGPAPEGLFGGPVTKLVKQIDQNNTVARNSGAYVSVVLFGEFSIKNPSPEDPRFAGALSELTAMEEYQRAVTSTPRLQILIANSGEDFGQGRRDAELISGLGEQDPHVVGVVGFPRSVEGVEQGIGVLHAAKIPMVGTTATADRFGYVQDGSIHVSGGNRLPGYPSPYYFHVGPTNFREATLAARFARHDLLSGVASPSAVIIRDGSPGDEYTNNLADDFTAALSAEHIRLHDPVYYSVQGGGITKATQDACRSNADLYFYAGRAPEFLDFLRAVEGESCGPEKVKVLASDDVIKVVADHGGQIQDLKRVEVYYSALASRELWRTGPTPTGFILGLLQGRLSKASEDNLILTYDAVSVFYQAASTAYRSGALPSKGDILYELARISGSSAWNGSSGVIDFADTERHDPVDKVIAIMKVADSKSGSSVPKVRCGRLRVEERSEVNPLCKDLPDAPARTPRPNGGAPETARPTGTAPETAPETARSGERAVDSAG